MDAAPWEPAHWPRHSPPMRLTPRATFPAGRHMAERWECVTSQQVGALGLTLSGEEEGEEAEDTSFKFVSDSVCSGGILGLRPREAMGTSRAELHAHSTVHCDKALDATARK